MAGNYIEPGENLDLTAPTGGVTTGVGALIGRLFVVALTTASAAAAFVGRRVGLWKLAKTSAQTWSVGDRIYWDNTNKVADNTLTAGARFIGYATTAAANPSSTGYVLLVPGFASWMVGQGEAVPAAASKNTAGGVTLTAAEIIGGIVVADPNGAGRTYTLPTAALLVAALQAPAIGDLLRCKLVNGADAAEAITIQEGTGGTWDANQTASSRVIGQNTSKDVLIRLTNVTASSEAYVVYA